MLDKKAIVAGEGCDELFQVRYRCYGDDVTEHCASGTGLSTALYVGTCTSDINCLFTTPRGLFRTDS